MKPIEATTTEKIRELEFDNIEMRGGFAATLDEGCIAIHYGAGQYLVIPRAAFDDLVIWYTTGTIPKHDSRLKRKRSEPKP